jgi:hypothetical protein
MLPDVPVKVMVGAEDATLDAAESVMVCGVPGARLSVAGVAVTPVGSPEIETETMPLKEFIEFAVNEICAPDAPLMMVVEAGVALREKSGAGGGEAVFIPPPPHEMTARQQSWHARKEANRPGGRLMGVGNRPKHKIVRIE